MIIQDHSLVNEFPAHVELIQELNLSDDNFHQLYNQYHELDREVRRIEEGLENTTDEVLEGMKLKRLNLKDQLFERLKQAQAV
ncbi:MULTISPECIES: YdcH family protein [Ferrimonas]|uniref:YdcH family protein n=1 Tax=Ferrimonas TaxID=44011 RepID=UPI0004178AE6|nr:MULTISPECIES: YdcH family protein [Ferrimonas]USD39624.1 YdcH family protein [Ferrimonas sp. SCSIO 43195]